jgi:hypothetical protein
MDSSARSQSQSQAIAEEVLRAIYGDDYKGCTVSPDQIAAIIQNGVRRHQAGERELLELYEKVIEAVDLLSKPPEISKVADPAELRVLLSERLDAIHTVTQKTRDTATRVAKSSQSSE